MTEHWASTTDHPDDDRLLRLADGELDPGAADRMRAHLENCWSCRTRMDDQQEVIRSFMSLYEGPFTAAIDPPPGRWTGFSRARQHAAAREPGRVLAMRSARRSESSTPLFRATRPSVSRIPMLLGWFTPAVALTLMLVIGNGEAPLSAATVLARAEAARAAYVRAVDEPVVYHAITVTRTRAGAAAAETAAREIWRDLATGRSVQRHAGAGSAVLDALDRTLRANRIDPEDPLSPASYRAWRLGAKAAADEVRTVGRSGRDAIVRVQTRVTGESRAGDIVAAVWDVRRHDWHPTRGVIRVREAGTAGSIDAFDEFTLEESKFTVVHKSTVRAMFEANAPVTPLVSEVVRGGAAPHVAPLTASALDGLELDGRHRIHVSSLAPPDAIEVDRRAREVVLTAYVRDRAARAALEARLSAFGPLTGIRFVVATGPEDRSAVPEATFETTVGDAEVAALHRWMRERSQAMNVHARALADLAEQWPAARLATLDFDAVSRWQSMVGDHARRIQEAAHGIGDAVAPRVNAWERPRLLQRTLIHRVSEVAPAAARLLSAARAFDRLVSPAANSQGPPAWSMAEAYRCAAEIEEYASVFGGAWLLNAAETWKEGDR
jgi:hypothetical protein